MNHRYHCGCCSATALEGQPGMPVVVAELELMTAAVAAVPAAEGVGLEASGALQTLR